MKARWRAFRESVEANVAKKDDEGGGHDVVAGGTSVARWKDTRSRFPSGTDAPVTPRAAQYESHANAICLRRGRTGRSVRDRSGRSALHAESRASGNARVAALSSADEGKPVASATDDRDKEPSGSFGIARPLGESLREFAAPRCAISARSRVVGWPRRHRAGLAPDDGAAPALTSGAAARGGRLSPRAGDVLGKATSWPGAQASDGTERLRGSREVRAHA
jgi:hypothetical protein